MRVKEATLPPWTKKQNNSSVKKILLWEDTRNTYKIGIVIFTSRAITKVCYVYSQSSPAPHCPTACHLFDFILIYLEYLLPFRKWPSSSFAVYRLWIYFVCISFNPYQICSFKLLGLSHPLWTVLFNRGLGIMSLTQVFMEVPPLLKT